MAGVMRETQAKKGNCVPQLRSAIQARTGLEVRLFRQGQEFHFAELDGVAFGLERDIALAHHPVGSGLDPLLGVGIIFIELRLGVFEHNFAIDEVADETVAVDLHLGRHPLVAVIGLGCGVDAVLGNQLILYDDMRAGRAQIAGGPFVRAVTAEKLDLEADGEVLILRHVAGGWQ